MASLLGLALIVLQAFADPGISGDSVYQLRSSWHNQVGQELKLKNLRGKPVVLAMAYTSCTYSCPVVVSKMKEIESSIKAAGLTDYRMVMASFDTKGDRPKDTSAYMKKKDLDPERWIWLSADEEKDVRELAAVLGVTYKKTGKADFAHSNQISVLDAEGRIAAQINGIAADTGPLLKALEARP